MPVSDTIDSRVKCICEQLAALLTPYKIITFGDKTSYPSGNVRDIDICVILEDGDKAEAEKNAYMHIESTIPFDLFVYNLNEWDTLVQDSGTFAARIARKGRIVYEK